MVHPATSKEALRRLRLRATETDHSASERLCPQSVIATHAWLANNVFVDQEVFDWHGSRQRTERRFGTCGRREFPSSGSRGISIGRTSRSGSSSPTTAAGGLPRVKDRSFDSRSRSERRSRGG